MKIRKIFGHLLKVRSAIEVRKVVSVLWLVAIIMASLFSFNYTPVTPIYGPAEVITQPQPSTTPSTTSSQTQPATPEVVVPAPEVQIVLLNQKAIDAAKKSALYTQTLTALVLFLGSAVLMFARRYERPFVPRFIAFLIGIAALAFSAILIGMSWIPTENYPIFVAPLAICAAAAGPVFALLAPSRQTTGRVGEAAEKINELINSQKESQEAVEQLKKDLDAEQSAHKKTLEKLETAANEKEIIRSEVDSLKANLEQTEARAAKAEFTSLAGSAQTALAQKQREYDEAAAALSQLNEYAAETAVEKRVSANEFARIAHTLASAAAKSHQTAVVLQYIDADGDEFHAAEATSHQDKEAADRALGVVYLADLDARAAELQATRLAEAKRLVEDAATALEEAKIDAAAEARRCEIVANAEIKFSEATRLNETAEVQLRQIHRIVNLVKVGERGGMELYSPTLAMPQTDTIHVVMRASGGSDSALHRTIEPGIVAADEVEIPKGRSIMLEVVDISMVNMSDTYRERHGLPAVLPPYGVGPEAVVIVN